MAVEMLERLDGKALERLDLQSLSNIVTTRANIGLRKGKAQSNKS